MKKQQKPIGSDPNCYDRQQSPTPKLSLFSLPSKPPEPPGLATPPIHTLASIPFQWEEVPGKPRPCPASGVQSKMKSARCLELPPRLLNEAKISYLPSPTAVLDGPYVGRSLSMSTQSLSFRKGKSFDNSNGKVNKKGKVIFGSSRWGSFSAGGGSDGSIGSIDEDSGGWDTKTKVKATGVKNTSSFLNFPSSKSNFLTSIKESVKQVVPWKLKQEKPRKIYQ